MVNVLTLAALRLFWELHPDAEAPLKRWYKTCRKATWRNIAEVRRVFPHADAVPVASGRIVTIFNVGGNNYRVICAMQYPFGRIRILCVLTHAEYDKGKWKDQL